MNNMGKLSSTIKTTSTKVSEQFENFGGGINTTAENNRLLDTESRELANITIESQGSLKKRYGSEVIYDVGYNLTTLEGWFGGVRPSLKFNPNLDQTDTDTNPGIGDNPYWKIGMFPDPESGLISQAEIDSFLDANKLLGHFTFEFNGEIQHYLVTVAGVFDVNGEKIPVYSYNPAHKTEADKYVLNNNIPFVYEESIIWDWIIRPTDTGYYLHRMIEEDGKQGMNIELDEQGNPKKYLLRELGRFSDTNDVDPNNDKWWPVANDKIQLHFQNPNAMEGIPEADIPDDFRECVKNAVMPPTKLSPDDKPIPSYFFLGGNTHKTRPLYKWGELGTPRNTRNFIFDDQWFRKLMGLSLSEDPKIIPFKEVNYNYEVNSIQFKNKTYLMLANKLYTFENDGKMIIREQEPYKPSFEEYNILKGNLLDVKNQSISSSDSYEILWNWDYTQDPNAITASGGTTPMVLGVMVNNIQVSGQPSKFRVVTIDKRGGGGGDKTGQWIFVWRIFVNADQDTGEGILLTGRPSSNKNLYGVTVPQTDVASISVTGTLNDHESAIPPELLAKPILYSPQNSRAYWVRSVNYGGTFIYPNEKAKMVYGYYTEMFDTNLMNGGIATTGSTHGTGFLYDDFTSTATGNRLSYCGSGVVTMCVKLSFSLDAEFIKNMFYGGTSVANIKKLYLEPQIDEFIKGAYDNNTQNNAGGGSHGNAIASAYAWLGFDNVDVSPDKDKYKNLYDAKLIPRYKMETGTSASNNWAVDTAWWRSAKTRQVKDCPNIKDLPIKNLTGSALFPNMKALDIYENTDDKQEKLIVSQYKNLCLPQLRKWIEATQTPIIPGGQLHYLGHSWITGKYYPRTDVSFKVNTVDKLNGSSHTSAINWATELNTYLDTVLGKAQEGVPTVPGGSPDSPLGAKSWTLKDVQDTPLMINILLVLDQVPNSGKNDKQTYCGRYSGFWEGTKIELGFDSVSDDKKISFSASSGSMSADMSAGGQNYTVKVPLTPIQNLSSYLPAVSSIGHIDELNNGYVYKSQYFTWNTTKAIIFYSDINNFSYFPVIQTFELTDYPDEQIQSMQIYGDSALIFTINRIYRLSGSNVNDFSIELVNDTVGSINPRTVKSIGNSLFFISKKGAYELKRSYSADNQLLTYPIDDKINDLYNPASDTIMCTSEGQKYSIHILNKKITLIYDTFNKVWTKNKYDTTNKILWVKNINNETFYVTNDYKICKFFSNKDYVNLKDNTTATSLDMQALYIDQLDRDVLFSNGKPNLDINTYPLRLDPWTYEVIDYDKDGNDIQTPTGFNIVNLTKQNLGYPVNAVWISKEFSGYDNQIHNNKKWKETQIKFTKDSFATSGFYKLAIDGNEVITPDIFEAELAEDGNIEMVINKVDGIANPKDKSVLTRNAGAFLSQSFIMASGDTNAPPEYFSIDEYDPEQSLLYTNNVASEMKDNRESNLRKKQGKKGYSAQITISNNEPLPFGVKSILLVYKIKKPK